MIRRLVDYALNNRLLVLAAAILLFAWGVVSFHNLPVEAYWSSSLLQPGQYTVWLETDSARNYLLHLRGEHMHTMILAGSITLENTSEHNQLKLEDVSGTYVVRELKAGGLGKDFKFSVAKSVRQQLDSASVRTPVNIPLVAAGGN